MQTIILTDKTEINNIKFAAINSIDGRLVIGVENLDISEMMKYQSIFSNTLLLNNISLTNNGDVIDTWSNYTIISNIFFNIDSNMLIIWLRRS